MKKPRSLFLPVITALPLVGLISGITLLFGIESGGSFDFFPGARLGAKVFFTFCGASLFLILTRYLMISVRELWGKNLQIYRVLAYILVATYLYGIIWVTNWLMER